MFWIELENVLYLVVGWGEKVGGMLFVFGFLFFVYVVVVFICKCIDGV